MSPALEFALKIKDLLTPGLQKAVSAGDSMGTKLKSQFTGIEYSGKRMNKSLDETKDALKQLERIRSGTHIKKEFDDATRSIKKLNSELDKMEGNSTKSGGGGFGISSLVKGNLITQGITALGGMAKSAMGSIITGFAEEQKNITGLKTFLGEAGAKAAYSNIKKDAAVTPFDTQSLLESNRALISAGASAEQARKDTMNLANAISAVGGGNAELSRMSANMQQIKTVGSATAMDIKQFAMAGINIYQLLADETGKNIEQVKKMDVTYDLLSRSLNKAAQQGGAYFGAMAAQGQTLEGKWSTLMDNFKMAATDIGAKLEPIISRLLGLAMQFSNKLGEWVEYLNPVFDIINQIPEYINNIVNGSSEWSGYFDTIKSLGISLWNTIKSLAANIWNIVSGVIDWMKKSELMKDLFWAIGKISEGVLAVISWAGDKLQWIWNNVIKPILNGVDWIYSKVKGLLGGGKAEVVVKDATQKITPEGVKAPGSLPVIAMPTPAGNKTGNLNLSEAKTKADGINQGGQRNITITIGKQIEKLEVHVMDAKEGAEEIESMVREAMRRVMYSLNGVAV
ncbi:MAG: tape measure protein [Verrucomicrobia bacterium]|nr:tape measure protein [Verrucomicrobiota bacterium]